MGKLGIVRCTGDDLTSLRIECFERDDYRCVDCGRTVRVDAPEWADNRAHMAHIEGRGRGGSDVITNVHTKCRRCHSDLEHNPKSVPKK